MESKDRSNFYLRTSVLLLALLHAAEAALKQRNDCERQIEKLLPQAEALHLLLHPPADTVIEIQSLGETNAIFIHSSALRVDRAPAPINSETDLWTSMVEYIGVFHLRQ